MILGASGIVKRAAVSVAVGWVLAWAFAHHAQPWVIVPAVAVVLATLTRATPLQWGEAGVLVGAGWFYLIPESVAGHWGGVPALVMYSWVCLALGLIFFFAGWVSRRWPLGRRAYALALIWPACSLAIEAGAMTPFLLAPAWAEHFQWLQCTRWVGAVGFDAFILLIAGALAAWATDGRKARHLSAATLVLTLLFCARYAPGPELGDAVTVAGLQPNVQPREFERATRSIFERRRIEKRLDAMTHAAIDGRPDLVVWPEGGNELANEQLPRRIRALQALSSSTTVAILTGSRAVGPRGQISNTAALWAQGRPTAIVHKANPVPFAEAKLTAGRPRSVSVGTARAGISICFDALFSGHAHSLVQAGAELLLVTSDDASLLSASLPVWHAAYARVRAIEVGRPLVFVSNAGPSFATQADGRLVAAMPQNVRGTLHATVRRASGLGSHWARRWLLAALLMGIALSIRGSAPTPRASQRAWLVSTLGPCVLVAILGAVGVVRSQNAASSPPPRDDISALFRQQEQQSCGAAALAFALTYLGAEVYEEAILAKTPRVDPNGYSMQELARIATDRGFMASGWAAHLADMKQLGGGVAIALLEVGHFVVVLSVTDTGVLLFDPALAQTVEVPVDVLDGLYSGRALFLVPQAIGSPL